MPRSSHRESVGFTLVEVLVAMLCLATLAAAAGGLESLARRAIRAAGDQTTTVALAIGRMEQLKDARVDDSLWTTAPSDSLHIDRPGFVDYFDARGTRLGTGSSPPPQAVFVCRWSVSPLTAHATRIVVLQVVALTAVADANARAAGSTSTAGLVRLVDFRIMDGS